MAFWIGYLSGKSKKEFKHINKKRKFKPDYQEEIINFLNYDGSEQA